MINIGDLVINNDNTVKAKYMGLGTFFTKEYIDMQAVIEIIRSGKSKLEMVGAVQSYQDKNRNIQLAILDINDRRALTAITSEKFIENYRGDDNAGAKNTEENN